MQLFVAFCGEGPIDERLIINLSERIIEEYLFQNSITAEISWLRIKKTGNSEESVISASIQSKSQDFLIFHRDADFESVEICISNHFQSGLNKIEQKKKEDACKNIVLSIPVQETEAWILCDKPKFKDLIETDLDNRTLNLTYKIGRIESIADPKRIIEDAIKIHKDSLPRRKRKFAVNLSEIYERAGQEVDMDLLEHLRSFQLFRNNLTDMLNLITEIKTPS